jgi:hypothetical protein
MARSLLALLITVLWLAPMAQPAAAQDDPFTGTWVLNVAKSKMQPATASKSEIIHYKITGDEEDFLSDAVTIEGYPESIKYTARYNDGKAYPFSITINGKVTNPGAMTMVKKIDAWTRERYNVRDGKPVLAFAAPRLARRKNDDPHHPSDGRAGPRGGQRSQDSREEVGFRRPISSVRL